MADKDWCEMCIYKPCNKTGLDKDYCFIRYLNSLCAAQRITAQDAIDIAILPAADVAPVVHAHYIISEDGDPRCSACGAKYIDSTRKYCPDCGARMDGADMWEE